MKFSSSFPIRHRCHRSSDPNLLKWLTAVFRINRQTIISHLGYLEEAKLIRNLYKNSQGIGSLQKPDKIFLENTNLMFLLKGEQMDVGNVRETILAIQLAHSHKLNFTDAGDFLVDRAFTIEVGGKNKTRKQLQNLTEAYIAADNIEYGNDKKIPLWLFGFLDFCIEIPLKYLNLWVPKKSWAFRCP